MAHTYEELKKMKVDELRTIAKEEEIDGTSQMNKDHVLEVICKKLNIDMHVHHHVEGIDKVAIKNEIKKLKEQRDKFIEEKKKADLKQVRKDIKKLKNKLRKAMV